MLDFFKIFANGRIVRGRNGKKHRSFLQYGEKFTGALKGDAIFWEVQANVGNLLGGDF